ncbi:hypothetical protein [Streptomyces peucetius]
MRWPQIAAKTRNETNDALCAITLAMLRDVRGRPSDELLRQALRNWAFVVPRPESRTAPPDVRLALRWAERASRPLTDLMDPAVMRVVLQALRLKHDGTVAAAETQRHKRMTLVNAVRYAIEQGRLRSDPVANVNWRIAKTVKQVDPRVVANPAQARFLLLPKARGRRLVGLLAGMYYAGLRPEEVAAVTLPDCVLPADGWGRVILHVTRPQAGKKWTDTGKLHDERGLKSRPPGNAIAQRALALRKAEGTLSGHALGEDTDAVKGPSYDLLADIAAVLPETEERVWNERIALRLAELRPEVYGGWKGENVTSALKPHGIKTRDVAGTTDDGARTTRRGIARADLTKAIAERDQNRGAA